VNAFKREPNYYTPENIEELLSVDPYFEWNLGEYQSFGKPCLAGETSFTVDGSGNVRRCHFIKQVIGNIYDSSFKRCLNARVCAAATCGCYIGYIHRPDLRLGELYGDGLLERIPSAWPKDQRDFISGEQSFGG
jgi:MoaA/NifB/PqqE/SkfB family radical SAM enzyme